MLALTRRRHGSWPWNLEMCLSSSWISISHTRPSWAPSNNFETIRLRLSPMPAGMREINYLRKLRFHAFFNQPFNYFLSKIGCHSTCASALAPCPPLPQTTPPVSHRTWSTHPTPAPTHVRNPVPRLAEPRAAPAASYSAGRGRSTVTPSGHTASPRDAPGLAMQTSAPVVPLSAPPPRHTGSPTPLSLTSPRPPLTPTPETGVHPPLGPSLRQIRTLFRHRPHPLHTLRGSADCSDAAGYDLSRLKPESSWALIQAEPRLAESILPASTST